MIGFSALARCVRAENRKLRGSPVWAAFIVMPLLSATYGTVNYAGNVSILKDGWYSLWTQNTLFYAMLFFAPLVGVYASYLWHLEHKGRNLNLLLAAPVPPFYLFAAKIVAVTKMVLLTQGWVFVLYVVGGKLVGLPGWPPARVLVWLLRGVLAGEAVIALQLLLSMCIRSFAVPVFLALAGGVAGLLMASMELGVYWPYALMLLGMNANRTQDVLAQGVGGFVISGGVFFSVFCLLAYLRLNFVDVKG